MRFSTRWRSVLVAVILVFQCVAARADESPLFFIETIGVDGTEYTSDAIVRAESRLREGTSYSEAQLRDAVARIRRLPFVVRSDFRLEKGSERGKFALIIELVETKPLFATFSSLQQWIETVRPIGSVVTPGETPSIVYEEVVEHHPLNFGAVGARWFIGSKGVGNVSADYVDCARCRSDIPRLSVGYTQYDIFGSRASLSALLQYRNESFEPPPFSTGDTDDRFSDHLAVQLTAAMPLFGNEALRLSYYRQTDSFSYPLANVPDSPIFVEKRPLDQSEIAWLHDTTDDPRFPTRGTFLKAAVESHRNHRITGEAGGFNRAYSEREHDLQGVMSRYWRLTSAQAFSAGVEYQSRGDRRLDEYTARIGYGADLWSREQTLRNGDLRFEASIDRVFMHYNDLTAYSTARVGVAFRNQWGSVDLGFQYLGWRDRP